MRDGNQIAAEIRGPGGDGLSPDSLEAAKGDGAMYGTVEYVNGPTMDEPLEIQGIVVYRTWRGLIDGGECMTGTCGSTGTIDYPGLTYEAYLDAIPSTQSAPLSWHGSLFAEGLDDGGLMYRRNRYYDPGTGQFTQEDPLGLAGGMNTYGFGLGDPVNYTDPFGLCGHEGEQPCASGAVAVGATAAAPEAGVAVAGAAPEVIAGGVLVVGSAMLYIAIRPAFPGSGKVSMGRGVGTWAAEASDTYDVPELPEGLTGENPREGSGNRINTDSKRDPQQVFDDLTGGQSETQPNGHQVGPNGVRLRPGSGDKGPRIDIPARPPRPHETIHFPPGV